MSKERVQFLEREEEYRLHVAYKNGDRRAGDRLIQAYMPLAYRYANEAKFPADLEERQQTALIAMSAALDQFDPETGFRLSTFAKKKIKWAFLDATNAALCRPYTETSPLRDQIDDWHEMPDDYTAEDMLMMSDEWAKRSQLLEDSIADLDDMHAELVKEVILNERRTAATPILKRHGSKDAATDSLDYALQCVTAVLHEKARERGLV